MNANHDRQFSASSEQLGAPTSGQLLRALTAAHGDVERCLVVLEAAIAGGATDTAAFSAARFRLSRASLARRQLFRKACAHVAAVGRPEELAMVRSLERDDADYARNSTEHVHRWPASEAIKDWTRFREESAMMRAKMRSAMRTEQRLLHPMLARHG